jgi:hypothetical protein
MSLAAIVGAALITYEFAIERGYGFSTPVALIRIAEVANASDGFGGSWLSGVGRLLTPALIVAWILAALCPERLLRRTRFVLIAGTLTVLWEQVMFEGGRFFLAALVLSWVAARAMRRKASGLPYRVRARPTRRLLVGFVCCAVMVMFAYVFIDRANAQDVDFSAAYSIFLLSYPVDASPETLQRLNGGGSGPIFALYMFWMYLSQGPNMFDELLSYPYLVHTFGLDEFSQIGRGLSKLTGLDFSYDPFTNMPSPGTYTTMVGASYMDFGVVVSWFVALGLGYFTARASQRLSGAVLGRMGLTAPILVTVSLFSPIVSLIVTLWPAFLWALCVGSTATTRSVRGRPPLRLRAKPSHSQIIAT